MSFEPQHVWHWQIAVYLFLGGLGGATFALASVIHLFEDCNKKMLSIAVFSSMAFLGLGTIFLLADMLQPFKAFYALTNPSSWIFWGVIFINGYFAIATFYIIPLLEEWPMLKPIIQKIPKKILSFIEKLNSAAAVAGASMGFLVAIYTGLLISAAPAISFWNTPAMPLLFVVSAFSTGAAYLLLLSALANSKESKHVANRLERLDAVLIIIELIILGAYFNFAFFLPSGAKYSANLLFGSWVFVVHFLIAGLLIPLGIETYSIFSKRKAHNRSIIVFASTLVLIGGYLLRHFVLKVGVFQFPW
jgi:formate-dependent nitrite reductase membrane component NrfD